MAQAVTKKILAALGGRARVAEIIREGRRLGFLDSDVQLEGQVSADLHALARWGEVVRRPDGYWQLVSAKTSK